MPKSLDLALYPEDTEGVYDDSFLFEENEQGNYDDSFLFEEPKYSLSINGFSKHLGTDQEYNEVNPGIGIIKHTGDKSYATAGYYKNSFSEPSYYAGLGYDEKFGDDYYAKLGVVAGVVSGYKRKLTPMVLPKLSLGMKNKGEVNLMYAPEYKDENPETLMLNYTVPIN